MTVTAEQILELSERTCDEPEAEQLDTIGLHWLAVAFPVHYPREYPSAVECAATFGGGVALDFDVGGHSYALDVNLRERVGILERIFPTAVNLGEFNLEDDANWRNIGAMIAADAGENAGNVTADATVSRHDPWRMLSDAVRSHHRMELNGWDGDEQTAEAIREWLRIAGEICGENYDHLYRELAARHPDAAAMVAESVNLQHTLMDVKRDQRQSAADAWLLLPEDEEFDC